MATEAAERFYVTKPEEEEDKF